MTGAAQIPLRLRAPPGGDANTRAPRASKRPRYTTLVTAPADVARAYFAGVTAHDADAIADCFAEDAELVTNTGTFHGREAIRGFYRDSLFQSDDVRPSPGPFIVDAGSEGERVCGAMKALVARRSEETKVWGESGHRSAAHWVAETTGETVGAACRTLETARALDALPDTDAAFRAGRLSPTQAAEITSAAGTDPTAESGLLDAAGSTSVKGLRDRCRQVRAGAEADDRAWARPPHLERRRHEWEPPDGVLRLAARLP